MKIEEKIKILKIKNKVDSAVEKAKQQAIEDGVEFNETKVNIVRNSLLKRFKITKQQYDTIDELIEEEDRKLESDIDVEIEKNGDMEDLLALTKKNIFRMGVIESKLKNLEAPSIYSWENIINKPTIISEGYVEEYVSSKLSFLTSRLSEYSDDIANCNEELSIIVTKTTEHGNKLIALEKTIAGMSVVFNHSDLKGITPNDHHAEKHTLESHLKSPLKDKLEWVVSNEFISSLHQFVLGNINTRIIDIAGITKNDADSWYLKLDGTTTPTANISMGGYKITNLGTPTEDADAATKKYVDDAISVENIFDRTGTVITPHTAGDSLNMGTGAIGIGTAPVLTQGITIAGQGTGITMTGANIGYGSFGYGLLNYLTVDGSYSNGFNILNSLTIDADNSGGKNIHNDIVVNGDSSEVYATFNDPLIHGSNSTGYGSYNMLSSATGTGQILYANYNYVSPHNSSVTAYGDYVTSTTSTNNNPSVNQIGIYVDWKLAGTDTGNKKWAFYNASTNTTAGKIFMGINDVKTYFGTSLASTIYDNGTDLLIERSSGSISLGSTPLITTGIGTIGTVNFGSATGVSATATDGRLTLQGKKTGGYNESIYFDFEVSSNQVRVGSDTGITAWFFQDPIANFGFSNGTTYGKSGIYVATQNFTLTQYAGGYIVPFTSYVSGVVANTLVLKNGNIGRQTTLPERAIEINTGAQTDGIRISYNDANGSATTYADLLLDSSGNLSITATGGDISLGVGGTTQAYIQDGAFLPETTNDIDLGDTTHIFKNAYINNYYVGTTAGIDSTHTVADGDGTNYHHYVFTKGILTSYTKDTNP